MNTIYKRYVKRGIDFVFALLLIIPLSLVLAVLALLVAAKLGTPVIFRQQRPGRNMKIFTIYKFRTMTGAQDADGKVLPDEMRLTGFGKKLRRLSLDELPELFNILKGEMSFIGPRPLLVQYLPRYNAEQARRHELRPGLTGWAQVNGRNAISWEEKFAYDVWYVEHLNFGLDCRILFRTVLAVLRREGISQEGAATMEEFMGTNVPDDEQS